MSEASTMNEHYASLRALDMVRDDLRETERLLARTAGEISALSEISRASQERTESRLDRLEKSSAKLMLMLAGVAGGGAATGQFLSNIFGG